jgi:hypothetical protein
LRFSPRPPEPRVFEFAATPVRIARASSNTRQSVDPCNYRNFFPRPPVATWPRGSYHVDRTSLQRTLRHCLKDYTFSVLKTPEPDRTHNVKLDQFHLLYPKLMLDSIKFEKIS